MRKAKKIKREKKRREDAGGLATSRDGKTKKKLMTFSDPMYIICMCIIENKRKKKYQRQTLRKKL